MAGIGAFVGTLARPIMGALGMGGGEAAAGGAMEGAGGGINPMTSFMMGKALGGGGGGGGASEGGGAPQQVQMPDPSQLSHIHQATDESAILPWAFDVEQVVKPGPHTQEVDVGESNPLILQHDDPGVTQEAKEKIEARTGAEFDHPSTQSQDYLGDPHEFSEQGGTTNQYDPSAPEGGTDTPMDPMNDPEFLASPEGKKVLSLINLIMEYQDPNKNGSENPELQSLHEKLEQQHPGYLQQEISPDEQRQAEAFGRHSNLPGPQIGPHPADNRTCSMCGGTLTVGEMTCPQCGASAWSATPQGPNPPQYTGPAAPGGQGMQAPNPTAPVMAMNKTSSDIPVTVNPQARWHAGVHFPLAGLEQKGAPGLLIDGQPYDPDPQTNPYFIMGANHSLDPESVTVSHPNPLVASYAAHTIGTGVSPDMRDPEGWARFMQTHEGPPPIDPQYLAPELQQASPATVAKLADGMPPMGPSGGPPGAGGPPPEAGDPSALGPMPPMAQPGPEPTYSGPHTKEQYAAVVQVLQDEGRDDEIENLIQNPQDYADELAKAQHAVNKPPLDAFGEGEPTPAQEEAPPEETMPVPGMASQQMASAVKRYAADSVAKQCPKCKGHTTGLLNPDGDSRCHSCGELFKTEVVQDKVDKEARDNPINVPAADQHGQRDVEHEQDSGHTWLNTSDEPLQVGAEYRMFSAQYDIPDIVRITAVKPDSIEYEIQGAYNVHHSTEVTRQDALMNQITFEGPLGSDVEDETAMEDGLNTNNDDATQSTGGSEQTDLSRPSIHMTRHRKLMDYDHSVPGTENWCHTCGDPMKEGYCPNCQPVDPRGEEDGGYGPAAGEPYGDYGPGPGREPYAPINPGKVGRTAGQHYTPMEQRELIDEFGSARNADKLDLEGTHYLEEPDDSFLWW